MNWKPFTRKIMATSSRLTMSFLRHARLGNKGLSNFIWGGISLPKCAETLFISSPSIQLSLGGLLSSRAHFCFTGRQQSKRRTDEVNAERQTQQTKSYLPILSDPQPQDYN